jgi:hypothetical protein
VLGRLVLAVPVIVGGKRVVVFVFVVCIINLVGVTAWVTVVV